MNKSHLVFCVFIVCCVFFLFVFAACRRKRKKRIATSHTFGNASKVLFIKILAMLQDLIVATFTLDQGLFF